MHGPPLVGWLLVVIGSATGVSCLLRTRAGCAAAPGERRTARDEGVMGLGMAVMAVPSAALREPAWGPPLFAAAFGLIAIRSVILVRREPHRAHHALEAAAMVYTALLMAVPSHASDGMADMSHGTPGIPALTALLLCYFAAYALWTAARMLPAAAPETQAAPTTALLAAPGLATACRISLSIGMLAMLLTM
ncbi:DUF5134 domain-containing protein [Streptantibioticus rubrisoli]|uniref:DUF5134 domain-containing protein n=1 Tax=Streptantibioticus rubrisoli TaxID=1387313 RepID=A0ABT1P940_9ACTN|nr:DUF5134 domain-containing protein [Streptantibioticus rubrisoli]MCQ4041875.1 DUF5134 domain-containing protein [Streptantibioticus rubrisoli]